MNFKVESNSIVAKSIIAIAIHIVSSLIPNPYNKQLYTELEQKKKKKKKEKKRVDKRPRRDSNPQSSDPKSDALSIRPRGQMENELVNCRYVGCRN